MGESENPTLAQQEQWFRRVLQHAPDVQYRSLTVGGRSALLIAAEGLSSPPWLQSSVIAPLNEVTQPPASLKELGTLVSIHGVKEMYDYREAVQELLRGRALLLLDGLSGLLRLEVREFQQRPVEQPTNELSIRGAKDSFVESLEVNRALLRRRLPTTDLHMEPFHFGDLSGTRVELLYLASRVNQQVLQAVRQRLQAIRTTRVLHSAEIEERLFGKRYSPFPLAQWTERPDRVVAGITEGRLAILIDNTPIVLVLPVTLSTLYQAPDDYAFSPPAGVFLRLIRVAGLTASLVLPALYVAFTSVNHGVLRVQLMLAIAASREGVPYPAFVEVIIMELMMELINEATVRLPKIIGGTATIVGGLIIGQAAAEAKIISNIMIVVTSASAIGNYTAPNYTVGIAWRLCKYGLILLAIPFGLHGMAAGSILLLLYLASLESFGIPYLSPLGPFRWSDMKEDSTIFRSPWSTMPDQQPGTYVPPPERTKP